MNGTVSQKRKTREKSSNWVPVWVVFVALLVDLLGFTVILPLMPSMLEYYGNNSNKDDLYHVVLSKVDGFRQLIGAPETERFNIVLFGGLLGSLYSFLQFFVSPLIGACSDVYGRKPMLLLSCAGVLISYILWSVSYNFPLFVASRVLAGLSKGIVSISIAMATDVTTEKDRSKAMALIGVAFSLGFIFGPTIGAAFSSIAISQSSASFSSFQYPALFSIFTATIVILIVVFAVKESLPPHSRALSVLGSRPLSLINPVSLFRFTSVKTMSGSRLSSLRWMSIAYFLYLLLFSGLEYSLTFHVHQRFNYTRMQQGRMFLFIGVLMALVQGGYLRRRPSGTEKATALMGMVAIIPGMVVIGWAVNVTMLYAGLALYSFGAGTVVSSLTTVASKFGEGDEKGKITGIFRSLGALARALGPFIACSAFWTYGSCLTYMIGGALVLVPLVILIATDLSVVTPSAGTVSAPATDVRKKEE